MTENNNPASEPLQKTGQAASAAVNTARATAKFAKGAAKLGKSPQPPRARRQVVFGERLQHSLGRTEN